MKLHLQIISSIGVAATLLGASLSSTAWAVSESKLSAAYTSEVQPYWRTGVEGSFEGVGKISIRFHKFEARSEKGAIIVVPGRAEPAAKYAELAYDLRKSGYSLYLMDLRGQGESDRLTSDPQVGHVDNFADYVTDLKTFIGQVVNARPHAKRFLLAHSAGGAVATLLMMSEPRIVTGAALVSPMFDINLGAISKPAAYGLAETAVAAGQGSRFALGMKPWDARAPFESDKGTGSLARFEAERKLLTESPALQVGGASYRWVQQALEAETKIRIDGPSLMRAPLLMMEAGRDQIVKTGAEQIFCAKAAHCHEALYADSKHSILNERDSVRDQALRDLLRFFASN